METTLQKESVCSPEINVSGEGPRIMLFDLSVRGHHPSYIHHLIRYWHAQQLPGKLEIVVSPRFLQEHSEVIEWVRQHRIESVEFTAITAAEESELNSRKSRYQRLLRNFKEWALLCRYVQFLEATKCLLMYFDTCRLPLAFATEAPCPVSGIYFRPTFHYQHFHRQNAQPTTVSTWAKDWQEQWLLKRILRRPQLETLFSLDPFVVEPITHFPGEFNVVPLVDPVEPQAVVGDRPQILREQLGIDANRQVFLVFGALTERKGLYQLIEAIEHLSPTQCQQICLLLVGESNIQAQLQDRLLALGQAKPIEIITHYEFVPEPDVPAYFHIADVVLAPYQRHVGMSGILLLAAAAQKPVLSTDYGLMGEVVRQYELGVTVDSTVATELAKGIGQFLSSEETAGQTFEKTAGKTDSWEALCDREKMKTFAEQNSTEHFAETIFQQLFRSSVSLPLGNS